MNKWFLPPGGWKIYQVDLNKNVNFSWLLAHVGSHNDKVLYITVIARL